jgi:hypothetical protein
VFEGKLVDHEIVTPESLTPQKLTYPIDGGVALVDAVVVKVPLGEVLLTPAEFAETTAKL